MRIYQLEGFYYVGKHLGYTAAANAMPYPIGQPAVFQQVKTLEGDLGIKLLSKPKKGKLQLTPEGRHLHDFIAPFFEKLPHLERALKGGENATLVIGAPHILITDWLPRYLTILRRRHPQAVIRLIEENDSNRLLAEVTTGRADIGIGFFPDLPPFISHKTVGMFEGAAIIPRNHPLHAKRGLTLKDLAGQPFVTYEAGSLVRTIIESAFKRAGLTLNVVCEAPTSEVMLHYVSLGLGLSIIPQIQGADSGRAYRDVKVIPLSGVFAPHPIQVIHRQGLAPTPLFETALKILTK